MLADWQVSIRQACAVIRFGYRRVHVLLKREG
jgi:hypothetical protein